MGMHDAAREISLYFGSYTFQKKEKKKRKGGKLDDPLARREGDVRAKAGSEKILYPRFTSESKPFTRSPLVNIVRR